jgi:molybdopterin synthase sulfur carrier subunit
MKAVYFAWIGERIGKAEEELALSAENSIVAELIGWLTRQGGAYAYAFEKAVVVRAAIDRRHVRYDAPIGDVREIAFFAPMTGG